MNETLKTIENRYSCRNFSEKLISKKDIETIAKSAIQAPSAMNAQPWKIIVVKNETIIKELEKESMNYFEQKGATDLIERINSRGGKMLYNAKSLFIVASPVNGGKYAYTDCGMVCQNITLAAESLGISSVIVGMVGVAFEGDKKEYFQEKLGIPEGFEFGLSVLLGYDSHKGKQHKLDFSKISYVE